MMIIKLIVAVIMAVSINLSINQSVTANSKLAWAKPRNVKVAPKTIVKYKNNKKDATVKFRQFLDPRPSKYS